MSEIPAGVDRRYRQGLWRAAEAKPLFTDAKNIIPASRVPLQ